MGIFASTGPMRVCEGSLECTKLDVSNSANIIRNGQETAEISRKPSWSIYRGGAPAISL